uniref:nickel pincer cofactor biosynthesis protein LarC n=1 Tax=Ndongobacter massiliensis TaxID=1871025 RepID=UPI0009305A38|nr:nickel pincer cofactor biosynthesis protein LarC [Ndongobacter massiliensis]
MKVLYLECNMGAAGDMLQAALLELHPDPQGFLTRLNAAGIPDVRVVAERAEKCGIHGTHVRVFVGEAEEISQDVPIGAAHPAELTHVHDHDHAHDHVHHHAHATLDAICRQIASLAIPEPVKKDATAVYQLIAEAEAKAHQCAVEEVHFHEVGTWDAVADVVGVCLLLHELAPDRIVASPVHVGSGQVRCAHGILPVPAPATASLLEGIPIYSGDVQGELCTPTGAALLRHFVQEYGRLPVMRLRKTGYGMGQKDFPVANCVRALWGEAEPHAEEVVELSCNIDDMTPEEVAFAGEELFRAGALDVYTIPIGMKKGRTGVLFVCMCRESQRQQFVELIFRHTSTIGMREAISRRYALRREERTWETAHGVVRVKHTFGYGTEKEKIEYEDAAQLARKEGRSLREIREALHKEHS